VQPDQTSIVPERPHEDGRAGIAFVAESAQGRPVIASVAFRRFKALRNASLTLAPFNLLIGPNGSGKSSLIQSLLRLRTLARLPLKAPAARIDKLAGSPEITVRFDPPFDDVEVVMTCVHDAQCDLLEVRPAGERPIASDWGALRAKLLSMRAYLFDHYAMALPSPRHDHLRLNSNGGNLAAVLARWQVEEPAAFDGVKTRFLRLLPEYQDVELISRDGGTVEIALKLIGDEEGLVMAEGLSQGTLCVLALAVLAHDSDPPALLSIEEVDRGIHPRLFREVRDLLYRLSYPAAQGVARPAVQVIATTHSPYLLDQFREHPEEVVLAEKQGRVATFSRLADREDLVAVLGEGSLGDLWFSGVLGAVPEEK
jgi:predicted ATPase